METVGLGLIPWCFGTMLVLGLGYLLVTLLFGELFEGAAGLFEGADGALEGLGVDFLPDDVPGQSTQGISCGMLAAFLAGFGVIGGLASLFGASAAASILLALVSGILLGALYFGLIGFLTRQQASSRLRAPDLIGQTARVTTRTGSGKTGEAFVDLHGYRLRYAIKEINKDPLLRGDLVSVERIEGGKLFVRKLEPTG